MGTGVVQNNPAIHGSYSFGEITKPTVIVMQSNTQLTSIGIVIWL